MTKFPKLDNWSAALTLTYDAWNRLVKLMDGASTVAAYSYNGLNHRVKRVVGNETRLFYFNDVWQCLEERIGTTVDLTYTWGLRYIDDLVCRDKGAERLYSLADPNWNVVALANTSGTVLERITYSAFGRVNWLDASFAGKTTSGYNWTRTFTGQVLDNETGLMLYRNRFYHPTLGRFVTRDPIRYEANDMSMYRYVGNMPLIYQDIFGLNGASAMVESNRSKWNIPGRIWDWFFPPALYNPSPAPPPVVPSIPGIPGGPGLGNIVPPVVLGGGSAVPRPLAPPKAILPKVPVSDPSLMLGSGQAGANLLLIKEWGDIIIGLPDDADPNMKDRVDNAVDKSKLFECLLPD